MDKAFLKSLYQEHKTTEKCPAPSVVSNWFNSLLGGLFPGICDFSFESEEEFETFFTKLENDLINILKCNECDHSNSALQNKNNFFEALPNIKSLLVKDVDALYMGDPAAKSNVEVTRSYPGFYAIAAHRVAHQLNKQGVALIPRMIAEHAHSETGVDIHPGATIGEYFCIDHGTGVVIGETTEIGNHVKIYQGVTLGALSVEKSAASTKRHPTIGDGVVIYAGATILGGKTTVGKNSIVGGSVWLTRSVPDNSKVYYKARMTNEEGDVDTITFKP